jgi:hypothetical protein
MQGPRYINPLSSILDIYTSGHGQSNCEMNYALGNMNHKYETWGIHSCFSYFDEVYTNDMLPMSVVIIAGVPYNAINLLLK